MSYSVHYGVGTDGKPDLVRIVDIISMEEPDIVGLQQISNRAMALGWQPSRSLSGGV